MARRDKDRKQRKAALPRPSVETRAAEAITVAWMVAALSTLICELGVGGLRLYLHFQPSPAAAFAAGFLLFAAVVSGIVTLVLALSAWKLRRVPPPLSVTVVAVIIGALPIIAVLFGA